MEYLNSLFNKLLPFIKKVFSISSVASGSKVDLGGVGERFSGESEVGQTSHAIDNSDYDSAVEAKRSEDIDQ